MIAVVGSIFLWMFWPSFNGALAEGTTQHRIMVNTTLGIVGSVLSACMTSRILFEKLDMEIVLNATLAGGVAIGSSCDLIVEPWAAIAVGMAGGILSAYGFAEIGPRLAKSKLFLQDTCGVHSLHGMPGVFAAIISMIYISTMGSKDCYDKSWFTITNPDTANGGLGLEYSD
jgi:ammonium transporter Rh